MTSFVVTLTAFDRVNQRGLYFKTDGKRFSEQRTVKICCDVKYDVTVTVKPSVGTLQKLVIGGDDIIPDKVDKKEDHTVYQFTWLTNGYTATAKGQRHELRFSFMFESVEMSTSFQVKFYPVQRVTHLTWGTEIHRIEVEGRGQFGAAAGFHSIAPTKVTFR